MEKKSVENPLQVMTLNLSLLADKYDLPFEGFLGFFLCQNVQCSQPPDDRVPENHGEQ